MDVRFAHHMSTSNVRQSHSHVRSDFRTLRDMDPDELLSRLKRSGVPQADVAKAIGRDRTVATKLFNGSRRIQANEIAPLTKLLEQATRGAGIADDTPDLPVVADTARAYVEIEVLPTFAGMGGGGTGDADQVTALLPRSLVEDELHARPSDLLLIDVRGDSMFDPATGRGFVHGDQILIDKRDTNPRQPGPFALWFDDGYVIKNVELIRKTGKLRIFSNNSAYSDDEADPDEVRIMGRPVWFGRRL